MIPQWAIDEYLNIATIDHEHNTIVLDNSVTIIFTAIEETVCRGRLMFRVDPATKLAFAYYHNKNSTKSIEKQKLTDGAVNISCTQFLTNYPSYVKQVQTLVDNQIEGFRFIAMGYCS